MLALKRKKTRVFVALVGGGGFYEGYIMYAAADYFTLSAQQNEKTATIIPHHAVAMIRVLED
jgi:hypothetical protein